MHEMSLCESILQQLEQQAQLHGYQQVRVVRLEIGQLACVEISAMQFCFAAVVNGSVAENAALEIIEVSGKAWCECCQTLVEISQRYDDCPQCGSYPLQIRDGEQMRIKELEVS